MKLTTIEAISRINDDKDLVFEVEMNGSELFFKYLFLFISYSFNGEYLFCVEEPTDECIPHTMIFRKEIPMLPMWQLSKHNKTYIQNRINEIGSKTNL